MKFDEKEVRDIYRRMIAAWNSGDADAMTRDFSENANIVGYDGTEVCGREQIRKHLAGIFADHKVASYVAVIRELREIVPDVAVLRGNVGMIPPGKKEVNRDRHAVQSLVAGRHGGRWQVELFQNTPAAWHGREADLRKLTAELQAAADKSSSNS